MVAIPFCLPFHYQLATLFSMSSTDTESDREHLLWEQGDCDISAHSYDSPSIEATVPSSQTTSGLKTSPCLHRNRLLFFHPYQHLFYKSEEVDLVEAISFAETNIRPERKPLSYLTILLIRYHRSQNGFNTPYYAMDIPLDIRHHSNSESRRLCSRHLVKLSPNQHLPHLVCVSLMSVYLQKQ